MSRGTLALAVFLLIALLYLPGGTASGDTGEKDIHSMTVYLDSSGSRDYEYMTWDFGDGSGADSRESPADINPVHTYAAEGSYRVVLTVHNSYGGGTDVSESMTVNILGPPTVTLMDGTEEIGGFRTADRTSKAFNPAERPPDPESGGREFLWWATSEGDAYDWDTPVREPITLHAVWGGTSETEAGGGSTLLMPSAAAVGLIVGVTALMLYVRRS